MSLLAEAVKVLLNDSQMRTAILDYLRANTPDKPWRQVWEYIDPETKTITVSMDRITGIPGPHERPVELVIEAYHSKELEVGWIGAYMRPQVKDDFYLYAIGKPSYSNYLYRTSMVGTYTETILHAQNGALAEARAAFAAYVEMENKKDD